MATIDKVKVVVLGDSGKYAFARIIQTIDFVHGINAD